MNALTAAQYTMDYRERTTHTNDAGYEYGLTHIRNAIEEAIGIGQFGVNIRYQLHPDQNLSDWRCIGECVVYTSMGYTLQFKNIQQTLENDGYTISVRSDSIYITWPEPIPDETTAS